MPKVLFVLSFAVASNAYAMMPSWYEFAQKVKATLGADRCIAVGNLIEPDAHDLPFVVPIRVCRQNKAEALSQIVGGTKEIPGASIYIEVSGPNGVLHPISQNNLTLEQAKAVIETALTGNPFFSKVSTSVRPGSLWLEFKQLVVQYYADNLANQYGQINDVAEFSFSDVLDLTALQPVNIDMTTASRNPTNK